MVEEKKRIPTLLALVILFFGVIGGIIFAESSLRFINRPGTDNIPTGVRITNITSSIASISWTSKDKTFSQVEYGPAGTPTKKMKIAFDDRTPIYGNKKYTTHHITLRNLSPATNYEFVIKVGDKSYLNKDKSFSFKTFATNKLSDIGPASGQVKYLDGKPAFGALVYSQVEGALLLSTLVQKSGNWVQPLNIAHNLETGLPIENRNTQSLNLYILSPTGEESQVITDTTKDSPIDPVLIGKNYDLRLAKAQDQKEKTVLGTRNSASIIQPRQNQKIPSNQPLIRGTGIPGEKVAIKIESSVQSEIVIVDKKGNWSWTPPKKLDPGNHKVTIQTKNIKGKTITEIRNFIILKSGSKVLGEATPSATLAPSPTPSDGAPTGDPTAIPTQSVSPTPTSSPIFSSPTPIATESAPVAGNITPIIILIGIGSLLVIFGLKPLRVF